MYFLLKTVIFHCYVSLPEGKSKGKARKFGTCTLQETKKYPTEREKRETNSTQTYLGPKRNILVFPGGYSRVKVDGTVTPGL